MKRNLFIPKTALAFLMALFSVWGWGQTTTFFNFSGTSGYLATPATGWTSSGTEGGAYLKLSPGSVTSPEYVASTSLTFNYTVASFGSGSNSNTKLTVLKSSDNSIINEYILTSASSSSYSTNQTLIIGTVTSPFKIKIEGLGSGDNTTGVKGTRLRNYSLTGQVAPNCTASTFSFATSPTVNKLTTDSPFTNVFATNNTSAKVYTSSDTSVATVNASTGEVTIVGAGNNVIIGVTQAADGTLCAVDTSYTLNVTAPIIAPTVTASTFSGTVGTSFSQTVSAANNPTSYAVSNGSTLLAGLSLNTSTGAITGTPTEAVTGFTTNITATNSAGSGSADITFNIAKGNQTLATFVDQNKFLSSPAFTFPATTDNTGLAVAYASSNPAVATVNGNTITIVGVGTTNIIATQAGNTNYNSFSQQIVLTVQNDPVAYNGIGRFEKITSVSDLTDGYYVVTNETDVYLMTSTRDANDIFFTSANSNASAGIIVNPSVNHVWLIQTNGTNARTIYNEAIQKYVGWQSGNSASAETVVADSNRWTFSYSSSKFNVNNVSTPARQLSYNNSDPRFATYGNANQQELQLFKRVETTTWNGLSWSNGLPDGKDVIFTGNYTTNSSFTAKNITIQNGGVLEITDGNTINAADVTVENGGNLIQRGNGALSYSGTFKVNKTGATLVDKYTFWASPVVSQNLNNIYAANPAFITEYDTPTNAFVNSPSATASIIGKGYSIKNPSANAAVSFTGVPNNGPLTLALDNSSFGYNLVGNPYPSDLNLGAFFTANAARITSTFYFWDTNSSGLNNNPGYAVFNAANGANPTWIAAPNTSSASPAGDVAKVGQGFIVKATANTPLTFDNTMRGAGTATFFNKNNNSNEGKYWLKLSSSYNTNNTIAVTYFAGASNAYDIYDSKALGLGVDALYATADAEKVVIQGRGAFTVSDIVPIASKHATTANFNIALTQKEGIFDNGQAIYLHDKVLGTYTNLQNTSYNFTANAGEVTDRFEVVYQLGTLSTSEAQKGEFEIYRDGNDFYARNSKNIEKIEVYDAAGRKIQDMNTASQLVKIQLDAKGFYIIKAKSGGKEYSKKITY